METLDRVELPLTDAERISLTRILRSGETAEVQRSRLQGFLGRFVACKDAQFDWVQLAEAVLRR